MATFPETALPNLSLCAVSSQLKVVELSWKRRDSNMISPTERKKSSFAKALLPSFGAEMKKYEEIYQVFAEEGYTKNLCEQYADAFVDNAKKPAVEDILQLVELYDRIHDLKNAQFYLEMLAEKKLSGDDKFAYCVASLKVLSKLGQWRDAEDFRTDNINFLQNFAQKKPQKQQADMYLALALTDCAAKHYTQAFRLMKFGYKPHGRNDTTLLEIFITVVYIFACSGDSEGLEDALGNARSCLKLFSGFEFPWMQQYYEQRIDDASNKII